MRAGGHDRRLCLGLLTAALIAPGAAFGHAEEPTGQRLPTLGPAPDFSLERAGGGRLTSRDLRGKVAVVTFIYTSCGDVCPLLTQKLVDVQDTLGAAFGRDVAFVSITLDPEVDTAPVLASYAQQLGSDAAGWTYLTGTPDEIARVAHAYGVVFQRQPDGEVVHNLLTSICDRSGNLRVQYMGMAFDPDRFEQDVRDLMAEAAPS